RAVAAVAGRAGILEIGDDAVLDVDRRGGGEENPEVAPCEPVDGEAAQADDVAGARLDAKAGECVGYDGHVADSVIAYIDGLRDGIAGVHIRREKHDFPARHRALERPTQGLAGGGDDRAAPGRVRSP